MEYSNRKFQVFINANCKEILDLEDFKFLENNFEKVILGDDERYCSIISKEPTYLAISNKYRIPDAYNVNARYKEGCTGLNEFLTIEEIKSIDYFEYVGENIYSIINQDKSMDAGDFLVSTSENVKLVTSKFLDYLANNELLADDNELRNELNSLLMLSEIGQKYKCDLCFFDGYYWE